MTAQDAVLGIDPGKTGAVVVLGLHRGELLSSWRCPTRREGKKLQFDVLGMLRVVDEASRRHAIRACAMEELQPFSRYARRKDEKERRIAPRNVFSMGWGAGVWTAAVVGCGLPDLQIIRPKDWQARVTALSGKGDRNALKRAIVVAAHERWPDLLPNPGKIEDGLADAAWIADRVRADCALEQRFPR